MYLFFDVETNGLHGKAFAFGYVLCDDAGREIKSGIHCCPYERTYDAFSGTKPNPWVVENVLPALPPPDCEINLRQLRNAFREVVKFAQSYPPNWGGNIFIASDVPYPCETGFLHECQRDAEQDGCVELSIYPLLDVASVLHAHGYDAVGTYERLPNELPAHNPLNDARQSARVFFATMHGEPLRVKP